MKNIITILFVLFIFNIYNLKAKSNYQKNGHVKYEVKKENDKYLIDYTFMDHLGNLIHINLEENIDKTDKDTDKFGIPKSFIGPYQSTPKIEAERAEIIKTGLFKIYENTLYVDMNAAINYYAPDYCQNISSKLINVLRENNLDNRHHRIEIAMKFAQDIPYGIPDNFEKKKFTGGAFSIPEILINGYGDCDSKTMLFAGILSYMISSKDIIFVGQKDHMLAAVKTNPIPGGTYILLEEDKYYIAETAGPGRQAFGEKGRDYKGTSREEPFIFTQPVEIPPTQNKDVGINAN